MKLKIIVHSTENGQNNRKCFYFSVGENHRQILKKLKKVICRLLSINWYERKRGTLQEKYKNIVAYRRQRLDHTD